MSDCKTFIASYRLRGATYGFQFIADSSADAVHHLSAIRGNATLDGELMAIIKIPTRMERIVRWITGAKP